MQFNPDNELSFTYAQDKHLPTTLIVKNTSPSIVMFKFKVSKPSKFFIKPSMGTLKPNQEIKITIVIHREIVQYVEQEKIQFLFGKDYRQCKNFDLFVSNGSRSDKLNLTMMITQKESRIKNLEEQVKNYQSMPVKTKSQDKQKGGIKVMLLLVIVGLVFGFISPIRLFSN